MNRPCYCLQVLHYMLTASQQSWLFSACECWGGMLMLLRQLIQNAVSGKYLGAVSAYIHDIHRQLLISCPPFFGPAIVHTARTENQHLLYSSLSCVPTMCPCHVSLHVSLSSVPATQPLFSTLLMPTSCILIPASQPSTLLPTPAASSEVLPPLTPHPHLPTLSTHTHITTRQVHQNEAIPTCYEG